MTPFVLFECGGGRTGKALRLAMGKLAWREGV